MCIIAIKEKGVAMPDLETLHNMWDNNPDGAGYMFPFKGKVAIRKGFMKFDDLMADLKELEKSIDIKKTPIILHFRIGTHGGNTPQNTHPFPISKNRKDLRKLYYTTDVGFAHNGIIHTVDDDPEISDTMMYAIQFLAPMKAISRSFYKDKNMLKLIENTINGSRMVFMDGAGCIRKVGSWTTDKETGMIYSNGTYACSYYSTRFGYRDFKAGKISSSGFGKQIQNEMSYEDGVFSTEDEDWDIQDDFGVYKRLRELDWVILYDGTELTAGDYASFVQAPLYVDESGDVYYSDEHDLILCEDVEMAMDMEGNQLVAYTASMASSRVEY